MMGNHRPNRVDGHAAQTASTHPMPDRQPSQACGGADAARLAHERQLLAAFPAMLFTCRPDGTWDYVSPALCVYTGRPAGALVELGWAAALHADNRAAGLLHWQLAISRGSPFAVEQQLRGADGVYRWFRIGCAARHTADGTLIGWAGIIASTESEHEAAAERALREQAQEARDERESALSTVGHELRTPLTVLVGQARLLQRRLEARAGVDPADQRAADTIVAQGQQLTKLISALLDAAHLDHGQLRICVTTLDLGALVERVALTLQPALPSHTLRLSAHRGPLWVAGDALRLEQVLHNLLQNAVKYSPEGGEIVLRTALDGERVQVDVCDQGIGIAASAQPALFQRFFRAGTESGQVMAGLGIGLYICKAIMDLHGGSITVESSKDVGSTFTLRLPRIQPLPGDTHNWPG